MHPDDADGSRELDFGGAVSYHRAGWAGKGAGQRRCRDAARFGVQEDVGHRSEVGCIIESADGTIRSWPTHWHLTLIGKSIIRLTPSFMAGACLQSELAPCRTRSARVNLTKLVCATSAFTPRCWLDGFIDLMEKGLVTGARRMIRTRPSSPSQRVRQTVQLPESQSARSRVPGGLHEPAGIISRNDRVFSINNATRIDLAGPVHLRIPQSSASHRHRRAVAIRPGAYASREGKSFICLSSTYDRRGAAQSDTFPTLKPGDVTTPRTDVMLSVTEYGMVNLKGESVPDRARASISIPTRGSAIDSVRSPRARAHLEGLLIYRSRTGWSYFT